MKFAVGPAWCALSVGASAAEAAPHFGKQLVVVPCKCKDAARKPRCVCWAALTLWQAVSFLCTAHCVDATSKCSVLSLQMKHTAKRELEFGAGSVICRSIAQVHIKPGTTVCLRVPGAN